MTSEASNEKQHKPLPVSRCPLSDNTEEDMREQRGTEWERGSTGALCLVP